MPVFSSIYDLTNRLSGLTNVADNPINFSMLVGISSAGVQSLFIPSIQTFNISGSTQRSDNIIPTGQVFNTSYHSPVKISLSAIWSPIFDFTNHQGIIANVLGGISQASSVITNASSGNVLGSFSSVQTNIFDTVKQTVAELKNNNIPIEFFNLPSSADAVVFRNRDFFNNFYISSFSFSEDYQYNELTGNITIEERYISSRNNLESIIRTIGRIG